MGHITIIFADDDDGDLWQIFALSECFLLNKFTAANGLS